MNWLRKHMGLDWFDLTVHTVITIGIGTIFVNNGDPEAVPYVLGVSLVLLAIRRRLALRGGSEGPGRGLTSGEMAAVRFEEMEERLGELEDLRARVAELEARVEFSERLLTEARDRADVTARTR